MQRIWSFVVSATSFVWAGAAALAGPGEWTGSGPEGGNVLEVTASMDVPSRIYLASRGGVFRSDNDGDSWIDISSGLPSRLVWTLATSDADGNRLYASVGRLYRSLNAGDAWQEPQPGWQVEWEAIHTLQVDDTDADQVFAASRLGGLRRSTDGGANWVRIDDPAQFEEIWSFLVLPDDPDIILMVALAAGDTDLGLFRSTDAGASWASVATGPVFSSTRLFANDNGTVIATMAGLISEDQGQTFTSLSLGPGLLLWPRAAAFDSSDVDRWYLGGDTGLVRTTDGGASYEVISDGMAPVGAGGYNAGVTTLALRPGNPQQLLVGSEHTGFYRSLDGGATWQRRNSGLLGVNVRSLAINPTNSNIMYAGQGDATSSLAENLWASFDGGNSWSPSNAGLELGGVRGLALDPNTAANPVTTSLYAVGWSLPLQDVTLPPRSASGGVAKSVSGGGSWSDIGGDLPFTMPPGFSLMRSVALDPSSGSGPEGQGPLQTVFVAGNGYIEYVDEGDDTLTPNVIRHRIYRSDDAGQNWFGADEGLPVPPWVDGLGSFVVSPIQVHVNPVNPDILYTATILSGHALLSNGVVPTIDNGIFRSSDGGQNWAMVSNGLPRHDPDQPDSSPWNVLALALAPSAPDTLYAAAQPIDAFRPSIVFRSDDGGASWSQVNTGIPADIDIRWLEVDPMDPDVVYAAGGGTIDNPGSIFRTENGGQEWVSYSIGLPPSSATVLAIDRSGPNPVVHAGTSGGVYSIEQVPDEDIDGVPDTIENGAPNAGDGNGDGIPDSLQPEVASLLAPATGRESRRGVSDYISLDLLDAGRDGTCTRLMSAHALGSTQFPFDAGYDYPYGLLRFEIPDCPGATVRIIFHDLDGKGFDDQWGFRVYAPDTPGELATIRWQFLPDAQADGNAWILQLSDGELGDLRPANNRILFQGGPARLPDNRIFADRFED